MNKERIKLLRKEKSLYQKKIARKSMCERCPHQDEIKTKSCHIHDLEGFSLEEPHVCTWHPDKLCRGCVEKMIMNDRGWLLDREKEVEYKEIGGISDLDKLIKQ